MTERFRADQFNGVYGGDYRWIHAGYLLAEAVALNWIGSLREFRARQDLYR